MRQRYFDQIKNVSNSLCAIAIMLSITTLKLDYSFGSETWKEAEEIYAAIRSSVETTRLHNNELADLTRSARVLNHHINNLDVRGKPSQESVKKSLDEVAAQIERCKRIGVNPNRVADVLKKNVKYTLVLTLLHGIATEAFGSTNGNEPNTWNDNLYVESSAGMVQPIKPPADYPNDSGLAAD